MRTYKIGREKLTVREIARRHGSCPQRLTSRLKAGWPLAMALSYPVRKPATYTFAGETMTLAQWSRVTGIHTAILRERITMRRWPLERVLTEPVMTRTERSVYRRNLSALSRIAASFRQEAGQ